MDPSPSGVLSPVRINHMSLPNDEDENENEAAKAVVIYTKKTFAPSLTKLENSNPKGLLGVLFVDRAPSLLASHIRLNSAISLDNKQLNSSFTKSQLENLSMFQNSSDVVEMTDLKTALEPLNNESERSKKDVVLYIFSTFNDLATKNADIVAKINSDKDLITIIIRTIIHYKNDLDALRELLNFHLKLCNHSLQLNLPALYMLMGCYIAIDDWPSVCDWFEYAVIQNDGEVASLASDNISAQMHCCDLRRRNALPPAMKEFKERRTNYNLIGLKKFKEEYVLVSLLKNLVCVTSAHIDHMLVLLTTFGGVQVIIDVLEQNMQSAKIVELCCIQLKNMSDLILGGVCKKETEIERLMKLVVKAMELYSEPGLAVATFSFMIKLLSEAKHSEKLIEMNITRYVDDLVAKNRGDPEVGVTGNSFKMILNQAVRELEEERAAESKGPTDHTNVDEMKTAESLRRMRTGRSRSKKALDAQGAEITRARAARSYTRHGNHKMSDAGKKKRVAHRRIRLPEGSCSQSVNEEQD